MPLFSSKRQQPQRHDLTCPECGHQQNESSMAVSTYCRGCGIHYKISNGQAVPVVKNPSNPFATYQKGSGLPRIRTEDGVSESSLGSNRAPSPSAPPKNTKPSKTPTSALVRLAAESTGLIASKQAQRDVVCFECEHTHQAPAEASSTLCPSCGAYIGLKNYDIRENWNRHIQTRGNVTIHKKASVTGITIRCHHLTNHGEFTGGVDCSGDFIISNHGKIMGRVKCKRLVIDKRANVEFANPVSCEDAIIDGDVHGNFTCSGKLALKKKATLTGDIKVATMSVEEGARHSGRMAIG